MALKSGGRKLSFDILSSNGFIDDDILLYRSNSDSICQTGGEISLSSPLNRKKRKNKGLKKKKKKDLMMMMISGSIEEEDPITDKTVDAVFDDDDHHHHQRKPVFYQENSSSFVANGLGGTDYQNYKYQTVVCEDEVKVAEEIDEEGVRTVHQIGGKDSHKFQPFVELRQRAVNGGGSGSSNELEETMAKEDNSNSTGLSSSVGQRSEPNGSIVNKLGTVESLDWKRLLAEDPTYLSSVDKSPVKYFMDEMFMGNSLRSTTIPGNEKERERVYDTIFRLPWRCELLINVGFFVCLDSFLSLLTIMPARLLMTVWRFFRTRQFQRPCAAELSDLSCLIVLVCGVAILQEIDISLIYHMIRGQGTIKLYVVYNVLEIFDKLCQNFGGDVLQTLFNSAEGLAFCTPENMNFCLWRFISDQALAAVASIFHSFILLAQAITLSTCIVSHNNALLALLVSNNFAEIKSNVFKRFSKENIHNLVYHDSVERFHISSFVLFVLAQNLLEAEGPWFGSFLFNALMVCVCEMIIDIIKHSFIAKFNEVKPTVYSEFLEDLCKQTLNIRPEDGRKNLTFIPLAPACVVIRVLAPVYAAHLPFGPLPWRLLWISLLSAMTYIMLASLKVMTGMSLYKFSTWYVQRCQKRKHHLHSD